MIRMLKFKILGQRTVIFNTFCQQLLNNELIDFFKFIKDSVVWFHFLKNTASYFKQLIDFKTRGIDLINSHQASKV